jgi:hypothetical protein
MEHFSVKFNQLVVKAAGKPKTAVRTFVTKPSNALQARMGKVFGLIEIESASPKIAPLIDTIIEEIKNNYYQSDFRPTVETATLTEQFEKALRKTNIAIASFLESEQITLDLDKINIIIGLAFNQELHLALVGNIEAMLFYCLPTSSFRIVNIIEASNFPMAAPDPLKLFSQIISGRIRMRDIAFIATANLMDYFSQDRLREILTGKPLNEGLIELKQLIEKAKSQENFGILTLELERSAAFEQKIVIVEEVAYRQESFKQSMNELIRTEKDTEKFLTPSLMPEIKKYFSAFFVMSFGLIGKIIPAAEKFLHREKKGIRSKINLTYFPARLKNQPRVKNITEKTGRILTPLKNIGRALFHIISAKIRSLPGLAFIRRLGLKTFGRLQGRLRQLPRSSKILLAISIILAVLFAISLITLAVNNYRRQIGEEFNQVVLEAESKKNSAESSVIYRDENQARKLLLEAKDLIAKLQPKSNYQKEYLIKLNADLDEQLKKLRHSVDITEPLQIVNFNNLDGQARIAGFAVLGKRLIYTQNQNNQTIDKANLDSRVMTAIASDAVKLGNLLFGAAVAGNELLFVNDQKQAFQLIVDKENILPVKLGLEAKAKITDLTNFKNWLYVLDSQNKQIYRLAKGQDGWGDSKNWIKEGADQLADAKSLAVDGSVYILKNDGRVIKLENGKPVAFEIKTVEPAFNSPTRIKTNEFSKYLYLLDPNNRRIVVIGKEKGDFVTQYYSPALSEMKDFLIEEKDKKIYVLNGNAIYGIPASHLK